MKPSWSRRRRRDGRKTEHCRTLRRYVYRAFTGALMKHDKASKAKEKAATYKKEGSDEAKSERKDGKMPKELLEHFKNKSKKK